MPEIITTGYYRVEFGGVLNLDIDYTVWKWISLGIYGQAELYPKYTEIIYPVMIEHKSPNSISYGLSVGFHF